MILRVSEDGRITIPASARKKLGIEPRSALRVDIGDDRVTIRPIKSVLDVAGVLHDAAEGKTTDCDTIREETMREAACQVEAESGI